MTNTGSKDDTNFEAFRDCFFNSILVAAESPSKGSHSKRRHASKKASNSGAEAASAVRHSSADTVSKGDPSELADFSDFIAAEVFESMPDDFRNLSHQALQNDALQAEKWSLPLTLGMLEELSAQITPTVTDSLIAYGLIRPPESDVQSFISPVVAAYITTTTTPPPKWIETRVSACEICERDWVPMTYHHLIPREVHVKVIKRGWHEEFMLNSVAWLCRACHSFVHKMASNEELAREWYTVDKICSRDDVLKWAQWVGKVRWKKQ